MDRARQNALQDWINEARRTRLITPLCRDIAEAMIWKTRKRPDGAFMAGYKALAGMARGCCRDTAIEAVTVLQRIGFLAKERTRVWCAALCKWVQGKNVYRLISPTFSESEKPTPDSSENPDSFLLCQPLTRPQPLDEVTDPVRGTTVSQRRAYRPAGARYETADLKSRNEQWTTNKEVADEQEEAEAAEADPQRDPAAETENGADDADGTGTRGSADGRAAQLPVESGPRCPDGAGVRSTTPRPARLFAEGMTALAAVLAERQRKMAREWRDRRERG